MTHDYQFEWDYDLVAPSRGFRKTAAGIVDKVKARLFFVVPDFSVGFVRNTNYLGLYIDGTSSHPMVALDVPNILESAHKHSVPLKTAIETTLMHELAHAIQEIYGLEMDEEVAESFAYNYWLHGTILCFWTPTPAI